MPTRIEHDSLGPVEIDSGRLWGAQTQRALLHFDIGTERLPADMIRAYARIKRACAIVHGEAGRLDAEQAAAIVTVCDELLAGRWDDEFPLSVWNSGSGTPFNMNVNEVIANRASQLASQPTGSHRPLHPNDHVNLAQSTNDTFPTAMHLAAATLLAGQLLPALARLHDAVATRAAEWNDLWKTGRTHLMDATPLTLGQEWSGYAAMLAAAMADLAHVQPVLHELTLGGTAVGSGINAPPGFADEVIARLAAETGLPLRPVANRFAAQGAHDALVRLSAALRTLAGSLFKIANDIRLLASGPRCGLAELQLPANEPGSSIMPGKVNPTQCEALTMLALQVMGNDMAVTLGNASGWLEMNVYKPLIIHNLLQSLRLLADGMTSFGRYLVEGCRPDPARLAQWLEASLMRVTALTPHIGYERAAAIARHAHENGLTLREAATGFGQVAEADFSRWLAEAQRRG
ncbi:class II fumarate hydratase [Laribacter hongkongensis]|uniref:class II fumarate hydratase n=1 Tax=Laribacter hongkongensis TaxID=168471 RepID=UPI001EFECDD0|nr:class II fumarate hydratase [Laribacter hongkongensis]MCG8995882.1 class II fumarate hydratase [Laribacter hongkongensis]MCG9011362.1 class II fumarate hydratase [Laribacter hongkongensis]MCG9023232.1 class II fumarate hydratase [Laribacter hongkongensis]MCG9047924.1 class II fumarate hydratase [Laribacter hongkongensis]MCG9074879.1 class II fumarate hydratase [Laribacter hongkongensis]